MDDDIRHVTRKGNEQPVGRLVSITGDLANVCWGIQDGNEYRETIPVDQLEDVDHVIHSPEEVQIRQARESGAHFKIEGDSNG